MRLPHHMLAYAERSESMPAYRHCEFNFNAPSSNSNIDLAFSYKRSITKLVRRRSHIDSSTITDIRHTPGLLPSQETPSFCYCKLPKGISCTAAYPSTPPAYSPPTHPRQPHQPPKNAKTVRWHTVCPAHFGFMGPSFCDVWVRSSTRGS